MCLLDCHDIMDLDDMISCINRIQCSVASPDMKAIYFQFIFQVEFLFVAIITGPGILFKTFECLENNSPGLFRKLVDGIH